MLKEYIEEFDIYIEIGKELIVLAEETKNSDISNSIKERLERMKDMKEHQESKERDEFYQLARELYQSTNLKINIIKNPVENLERQLYTFLSETEVTENLKREAMVLVQVQLEEAMDSFTSELKKYRLEKSKEIKEVLEVVYRKNLDANVKELMSLLIKALEDEVERGYREWIKIQNQQIIERYKDITAKYISKLNEAIAIINSITDLNFNIKVSDFIINTEVINRDSFCFEFQSSSSPSPVPASKDFLWILPKRLRSKKILSHVLGSIEEELERNGDNLKQEYIMRIKDSKDIFEGFYKERIDNLKEKIESRVIQVIKLKKDGQDHIKEDVELYQRLSKDIEKIINEFKKDG